VSDGRGTTSYRIDAAVVVRVVGSLFVVVGLAWVLVILTAGRSAALVAVAVVTVVLAAGAVWASIRPPRVLTLSEDGFRVSFVRGAGSKTGTWDEVEAVDAGLAGRSPSIVLTLTSGRSTVIPVSLLGRRNVEAQRDMHDRLNDAYGYRHLTPRDRPPRGRGRAD
jgi:hypothetical protein